jgi:hypothetical protein
MRYATYMARQVHLLIPDAQITRALAELIARRHESQGPGKRQGEPESEKRFVFTSEGGGLLPGVCRLRQPGGLLPRVWPRGLKGEPASGAVVYFHQESLSTVVPDGRPPTIASGSIPVGIADNDGNFSLTCEGAGDGCPPGKYVVLVEWRGKPDSQVADTTPIRAKGKGKAKTPEYKVNKQMARQGVDRLKGRYFDISKPLLRAEVLPQSNSLPPFEIGG